jgi:hypothetical protein
LGFAEGWLDGGACDCAGAGRGPGEACAFNLAGMTEIVSRNPQLRAIEVFFIFKVGLNFTSLNAK